MPDFDDRDGYNPLFLGDAFRVDLPGLGDHEDDAFRPDDVPAGESPFALRYRRFSVIQSKSLKFCRVTAVNIAGDEPYFRIPRRGWRLDPRAQGVQQDDEVLYGPNTFSRGHMVRRQDPLWGTRDMAQQANADTFHYTNAVPQVQSFNGGLWGRLEDHILDQGQTRQGRLNVFTGPIFTEDDPLYINDTIAVPLQFYKVVVAVKDSEDAVIATAFIQSQEDVMPPEGGFAPGFDPGAFTPYQVKLSTLEGMTGLSFGLNDFDVLAGRDDLQPFGAAGLPGIELLSDDQIVF